MKTALILGAGGMIGNQLCKKLKKEGYWVRGVDIKYPEYNEPVCDEFIIADLRDYANVSKVMFSPTQRALKDDNVFDYCFALMARMGGALYIFSKNSDSEIIYDSAIMNLNVAKAASEIGVKKLFFSSSACCYPEKIQEDLNSPALKESFAWEYGKPDSVYGVEKLFAEEVYDSFRRNNGLEVRIARFHNIFSTECAYNNGLEKFPAACCYKVASASNGGIVQIFGDGLQQRSFLWIDEALEGVMRLVESNYYLPLNIGSDEMIGINDLTKMVIGFSGKNLSIVNIPSDATGVRGRNSDNTLIKKVLGWSPSQPLEVGMRKLYNWIESQIKK